MSKKGNKYYYRAEIWFGDNGGIYGEKHKNFKDCIPDLNNLMIRYVHHKGNEVVYAKIQKRYKEDDKEFICPQNLN